MQKINSKIMLIYIGVIALLMTLPMGSATINNTFVVGLRADYIIHCVIYLPWMFLCTKEYRTIWLILGVTAVAALECVQMLLPYRGFNINDIIAGTVGVLISSLVAFAFRIIKNKI